MNRNKQAKKIDQRVRELFKENPGLREALRLFDISYDQYQRALEGNYSYFTDTSTTPEQKTKS